MIVEIERQQHGIDLIKIDNNETSIVFTNFGARIVAWKYSDSNIVLGNRVEADEFYPNNDLKFGATIGRYGGRIEDGKFELDGKSYQLECNDGTNHIHGGSHGTDSMLFDYEIIEGITEIKIIFKTKIGSVQDGYPGDLTLKVIHTYDVEHRWTINYEAETTETTLFNPTNHVYFNLNRDNNVINNHCIKSDALNMYQLNQNVVKDLSLFNLNDIVEENSISFDEIFTTQHPILKKQIEQYDGLDHPFELDNGTISFENEEFILEVGTDMPNVVIYTLNTPSDWNHHLNIYKPHSGFTVETQYLPNDINLKQSNAPSILKTGEQFKSTSWYQIRKK